MIARLYLLAALVLSSSGLPASAQVSPLTPETRVMLAKQAWLEEAASARFGHQRVSQTYDWRAAYGSILFAEERDGAIPRLLMKDEHGWFEIQPRRSRRLPRRIGRELDRLVLHDGLWDERAFDHAPTCGGDALLYVLRHAGRRQIGRAPCGWAGLSGRAVAVAASGRIPPRGGDAVSVRPSYPPAPGVPQADHDLTVHISRRLSEMTASWERGLLAGLVDPYADNSVVERPDGVLRGRRALVEWARRQQDWASPEMGSQRTLHHASIEPPRDDVLYETREIRWEENGRPLRQTFSALWRNRDGLWQIAHERAGPVMAMADGPVR